MRLLWPTTASETLRSWSKRPDQTAYTEGVSDFIIIFGLLAFMCVSLVYLRRRHFRRTASERPPKVFVGTRPIRSSCVTVRDGQKLHDEIERAYRGDPDA